MLSRRFSPLDAAPMSLKRRAAPAVLDPRGWRAAGTRLSHHRLANGVDLVGVPLPTPSACFALSLKRGSIHEPARLNGVTHLVEHLLFQGTQQRSNQEVQAAIAAIGAEVNALTSWPGVCCYARALHRHWEPCLRLVTEVMTRPRFTAQALASERTIIHQERTRILANPKYLAIEALMAARYPGHPLARPIIGTDETLAAMSLADVERYFNDILRPEHLALIVTGTFDWADVCAVAEEELGVLNAIGPGPPADPPPEAPSSQIFVRENFSFPNVHLAYEFPAAAYRGVDYYASQLLATLLGDEKRTSSRLLRGIQQSGLAHEVFSSYQGFDDHGILYTYAATTPEKAAAAHHAILDEFARLHDVTDDEVERACRKLLSRIALDAESSQKRALAMARLFTGSGRLEDLDQLGAQFRAVTADDVCRLLDRHRPRDTWIGVALGPIRAI
jgi:predicted Zn-dependent peptidase